jgi:exosortase family protein XrtF
MLKDFKPALRFLSVFIGAYFVLNLVYGLWIYSLETKPDAMTYWVSQQTAALENCTYEVNHLRPTVFLRDSSGKIVLNIFEGCNGINVMIVFFSFIIAFGGSLMRMLWFIPFGLALIHAFNIVRLLFLYYLAVHHTTYFYYFHKYFFTAVIYILVFALWWVWVKYLGIRQPDADVQTP